MQQQTLLSSFANAFNGLFNFFIKDRNGRIELCVALLTTGTAAWLHATIGEWLCILLCIGAVLCLEMLNSALEKLCDVVHKEYHPAIRFVKDVAAGSVLLASLVSFIIACIIFLPKIF